MQLRKILKDGSIRTATQIRNISLRNQLLQKKIKVP
jgi:hypothetical protein